MSRKGGDLHSNPPLCLIHQAPCRPTRVLELQFLVLSWSHLALCLLDCAQGRMLLGMPTQPSLLHWRLLPLILWRSWLLLLPWEWGQATADLSLLRRILPRMLMQKRTRRLLFHSARWFCFSRRSLLRWSGARKHPLSACLRAKWTLLGSDLFDQSQACPDSLIF